MKRKRVASYQNSVLGQAREDENYAQAEEVDFGQKQTQSGEAEGQAEGERRCWRWVGDGRGFDHCDFSLTWEANSSGESEDWEEVWNFIIVTWEWKEGECREIFNDCLAAGRLVATDLK